jgi:serine/threonine-protein kinase
LAAELDHLVARATNRDPDQRPADARVFLAEVSAARRAMSDGELDVLGPALAAVQGRPDQTLVVDLTQRPYAAARRGDTGPMSAPPGAGHSRRRSRGPLALLIIIALALVLSGAAWFVAYGPLSTTTTPSLLGKTRAEAAAIAKRDGLSVRVKGHDYSEVTEKGLVLRTDPKGGSPVDKGGTIGLILSNGPERYAVPSVVGKTEQVARAELSKHLTVQRDEAFSQKVEEGSVISTDPPAGEQLKPHTAVTMVVSKGPKPVAVPNVVNQPVDQAKAAIEGVGLVPRITMKFDEAVPKDAVISQSPEGGAGQTAGKGTDVELVVSKGPPLVPVPGVVGKNVAEAQALISAAGLVPSVQQLPGGPGTVLNQSPNGDEKAPKGSTVTLYVF